MSARRLLAALVAIAWLLPAAVSGAFVLHLVLEDHGSGAHAGAGDHDELVETLAHGHAHSVDDAAHRHSGVLAAAAAAAARRAPDTASPYSATGDGRGPGAAATASPDPPRAGALAGPARASGPPLLARLSTLRI